MAKILTKQNTKKRRSARVVRSAKKPVKRIKAGYMDYTFLLVLFVLVCVGLIILLSASAPSASVKRGNSYYFFERQLLFTVLGFVAMIFISRIDYRKFKKWTPAFMIICTLLLVLVLIPKIGIVHNESRRWLPTPFGEIQPSEIMKLAIAMFFAAKIENSKKDISKIKNIIPYLLWIAIVAFLMLKQTHVSGTIVICGIAVCVLIMGGANVPMFIGAGISAIVLGLPAIYLIFPKRWGRVVSFLNPFLDTQDAGYQVIQGLYAIGSGGIFGLGLGQSIQKYSYLPEPYNDFIFAIVCEELGLIGAILIIGLFAALIIRGIKIALDAPDIFGTLTVVGIIAQIGIQTVFNIAVATSSIPNTGISLPFFSYGGTAQMILLAEMGIVLSVSRYSKKKSIASKAGKESKK